MICKFTVLVSLALILFAMIAGSVWFYFAERRCDRQRVGELEILLAKAESANHLKTYSQSRIRPRLFCVQNVPFFAGSAFVNAVSHELRTPLSVLSSVIDLLRRSKLEPEQRDCVSLMNASLQVMLRIINDILMSAKVNHLCDDGCVFLILCAVS